MVLDASDSFLLDRVMNLPERIVQKQNYEQDHFLRRLSGYRERSMEEETVVNFFDELDLSLLYLGKINPCSFSRSSVQDLFKTSDHFFLLFLSRGDQQQ